MKKTPALVLPHTHWDRAWYWPFERFRIRLIECIAQALDLLEKNPKYRFNLDGQVIPLEDYLEARPQDKSRVEKFVRAGRLVLGPFYCQPDLYCTGGEALIRNLLVGSYVAREFGGAQKMVYMADTFGIIPEMPMVLSGFGFGVFSFMRGMAGEVPGFNDMKGLKGVTPQVPKEQRMFIWIGPDGSEVRVFRLRDGYANAARLGIIPAKDGNKLRSDFSLKKATEQLLAATKRQDDAQGQPLLLLAGVDHQIPQKELPAIIKKAEQESPYRFELATFNDLKDEVEKLNTRKWARYQGEFHGSGSASVLGGTVSSRVYLKQMNAAAERLLVQQAEMADAFNLLLGTDDLSSGAITTAWKHLLKCHPHDDICGCSVDAVHQDNEYHFRQAAISAQAITRRMIYSLVEKFGGNREGDDRFCQLVVNTQPFPIRKRVTLQFDFEAQKTWGDYRPPKNIQLVTEAGEVVPHVELKRAQSYEHPHPMMIVEALVDLPPASLTRIYLQEGKPEKSVSRAWELENEHLRVKVHPNGSLDLLDKATGTWRKSLGLFSGQADIGDEYDFADIPEQAEEVHRGAKFKLLEAASAGGLQFIHLQGLLPVVSTPEAKKQKQTFDVRLSLAPGENSLQVHIRTINLGENHRIRWNLPLLSVPQVSRAGLKFSEVFRPCGEAPVGNKPPRIHPEHPLDAYVAVEDSAKGGIALFAENPLCYEVVKKQKRLAVTLYRSIAWLSNRVENSTRPGRGAGPDTPTLESQMLGRALEFRFALRPFAKKESRLLLREALLWRWSPVIGQSEVWYPRRKDISFSGPFFQVSGPVIVSALKRGQKGSGVILRLHNPTPSKVSAVLKGFEKLTEVGLNEAPLASKAALSATKGALKLEFAPFALRSFLLPASSFRAFLKK